MKQSGSHLWFAATDPSGDLMEEFNEDCSFPLQDLSHQSARSQYDALFAYNLADMNLASKHLSIPWETSKDQSFSSSTIYIGFYWDLENRIVSLAPSKVEKYLGAIQEWLNRPKHVLKDVQSLYGKLLHACFAIYRGHAYLTGLEKILHVCADKPFMPYRPVRSIAVDLKWWILCLQRGKVARPIKPPIVPSNPTAYSDASSSIGIAIVIGQRWHA